MALLTNSSLLLPKLPTQTQTQTLSPATFHLNHSRSYNQSSTAESSVSLWLHNENRKFKTKSSTADKQEVEMNKEEEEEEYRVLTAIRSSYNDIVIVDTAQARMLLLDSTRMFLQFFHINQHHPSFCSSFNCGLLVQIMCIAFFTRTRNGLIHIGYV